jgi:hypothetical protein
VIGVKLPHRGEEMDVVVARLIAAELAVIAVLIRVEIC